MFTATALPIADEATRAATLADIKAHCDRFPTERELLLKWVDATAYYAPMRERGLARLRREGWRV